MASRISRVDVGQERGLLWGTAQGDFPVGNPERGNRGFLSGTGRGCVGHGRCLPWRTGQDLLSLKVIGKKGNGKRIYIALFFCSIAAYTVELRCT